MNGTDLLNRIFFSLSDPTRRNILSRLVIEDMSIGALSEHYEISLPALSKHLQNLQDAELVEIRKEGRTRIVRFSPENLATAQIWLATINDEGTLFDQLEDDIERMIEELE